MIARGPGGRRFAACLAAALALGCGGADDNEVVFRIVPGAPGGAQTLPGAEGTYVVDRAHLSFTKLELRPCESAAARARWLPFRLVRAAHAHTTSTPTSLGTTQVVNVLAGSAGAVTVGRLAPPSWTYCAVRVFVGAADADAQGAAAAPDIVGQSFVMGGHVERAGAAPAPFAQSTPAKAMADLPIPPLDLRGRTRAVITITSDAAKLFSGVAVGADPAAAARAVVGNVAGALGATVE